MSVLVVDVGGTHIKFLTTGQTQPRKFDSGSELTALQMVEGVKSLLGDWQYSRASVGYPGPVLNGKPVCEPKNLGKGWVGFDFSSALGCPVQVINDAAMQALGSYHGGRMLFLGLGTGLGTAMIVDDVLEPMELGHMSYRKRTYEDYVGLRGLEEFGKKKWRNLVTDVVQQLSAALLPDEIVLGGGNAKYLKELPPKCRLGENANAFLGGFRLWNDAAAAESGAKAPLSAT